MPKAGPHRFPLVPWLDREFDHEFYRVGNWLVLIVSLGFVPLLFFGATAATIAIGVIWGAPWCLLFGWRGYRWLQRFEARERRRRDSQRRKRLRRGSEAD